MNLIGVVLPYLAKKDMACSPVKMERCVFYTSALTNSAFYILFGGFLLSTLNKLFTISWKNTSASYSGTSWPSILLSSFSKNSSPPSAGAP